MWGLAIVFICFGLTLCICLSWLLWLVYNRDDPRVLPSYQDFGFFRFDHNKGGRVGLSREKLCGTYGNGPCNACCCWRHVSVTDDAKALFVCDKDALNAILFHSKQINNKKRCNMPLCECVYATFFLLIFYCLIRLLDCVPKGVIHWRRFLWQWLHVLITLFSSSFFMFQILKFVITSLIA